MTASPLGLHRCKRGWLGIPSQDRVTTTIHISGGSFDGMGPSKLKKDTMFSCGPDGNADVATPQCETDFKNTTVPTFYTKIQGSSHSTGSQFTAATGCKKESAAETVACLRKLSTQEVLANQPSSAERLAEPTGLTAFFPNVDGKLIPQQTASALALGQFHRVPVIIGTTRDEGSLFIALSFDLSAGAPLKAGDYPAKIAATAKALAAQSGGSADEITRRILAEYPLRNYASPNQALAAVVGDGTFSARR